MVSASTSDQKIVAEVRDLVVWTEQTRPEGSDAHADSLATIGKAL